MADAIELTFLSGTAPPKRMGPYRCLRVEHEILRAEPGGRSIARHEDHAWRVDGESYSRLECSGRTTVHFERTDGTPSRSYGPFDSVSFIDGVAYVDHHIFAFVDRAIVDWYCHEDDEHWPLMIISPVE